MPRHPKPCWDSINERWRTRINGKQYYIGTKNSDYADVLERFSKLYRELTGLAVHPDPPPMTIMELVNAWMRAHGYFSLAPLNRWPRPARWRHDNLSKWVEFCESIELLAVDDITTDNLKRFTDYCRSKGWTNWTIRHYVYSARAVCDWGHQQGHVPVAVDRVKLPKGQYQPQDIAPADIGKLLKKIESSPRLARAGRIIRFCLLTGCRPGEARLLKWGQVRIDQSIALLGRGEHKTGNKTGRTRTIHLSGEAIELLRSIKPSKAPDSQHVFISRLGEPYTRDGLAAIVGRLGAHPYALRHTWAQSMVDGGVPLEVVSKAMGHASVVTTMYYAEVRSQRILDALETVPSPVQRGLDAQARPAASPSSGGRSRKSGSPKARSQNQGKSARDRRAS